MKMTTKQNIDLFAEKDTDLEKTKIINFNMN